MVCLNCKQGTSHVLKICTTLMVLFLFGMVFLQCASQEAMNHRVLNQNRKVNQNQENVGHVFYGKASYYGPKYHGKKTASGEIFNQYALTAAHKTLPFGTRCRVTNQKNGKQVVVRINDRGPFVEGRVLDLSYGAAKAVDAIGDGVFDVKVEILRSNTN